MIATMDRVRLDAFTEKDRVFEALELGGLEPCPDVASEAVRPLPVHPLDEPAPALHDDGRRAEATTLGAGWISERSYMLAVW